MLCYYKHIYINYLDISLRKRLLKYNSSSVTQLVSDEAEIGSSIHALSLMILPNDPGKTTVAWTHVEAMMVERSGKIKKCSDQTRDKTG